MNKFQQATAGLKSGIESGMDNIRSEYEQAMWGRQTTGGECEIFTNPPEHDPLDPTKNFLGTSQPEQDLDVDDGMDI